MCYSIRAAEACVQAFRCGGRYPSASTHPADGEPVTEQQRREALPSTIAQAHSETYLAGWPLGQGTEASVPKR